LLAHYRSLIKARNQHAALRVGDLNVVISSDDALYSILRISEEEAVLVLINLTGESVSDYRLVLEKSSLPEGSYIPLAIFGEGEFNLLSVNSDGGFSEYSPVPVVLPYSTIILQLRQDLNDN